MAGLTPKYIDATNLKALAMAAALTIYHHAL